LSRLERLTLNRTFVTDTGLTHLRSLNELRQLELIETQVTPAGIAKLKQALPKCQIEGP
jgi:hypothetical protein